MQEKNKNKSKNSVNHRLKIISGQINGLAKMIEEDKYCVDIITQSTAIQRALQQLDKIILEEHINHCVVDQMQTGESDKAVEELVKIFSISRK